MLHLQVFRCIYIVPKHISGRIRWWNVIIVCFIRWLVNYRLQTGLIHGIFITPLKLIRCTCEWTLSIRPITSLLVWIFAGSIHRIGVACHSFAKSSSLIYLPNFFLRTRIEWYVSLCPRNTHSGFMLKNSLANAVIWLIGYSADVKQRFFFLVTRTIGQNYAKNPVSILFKGISMHILFYSSKDASPAFIDSVPIGLTKSILYSEHRFMSSSLLARTQMISYDYTVGELSVAILE